MSGVGRRSTFSYEGNETRLHGFQKRDTNEYYSCIVLDVCGAHKPTSRFHDEIFESGVWFIVGCKDLVDIFAVCWGGSYDELRTVFGTNENIVGRNCTVISSSAKKSRLKYAKIVFDETRAVSFMDEKENSFYSTSSMYGIISNYETQMNAFKRNPKSGDGEVWRRIK